MAKAKEIVVNYLNQNLGKELSVSDISKGTGLNGRQIRKVLRRLAKRGLIKHYSAGISKRVLVESPIPLEEERKRKEIPKPEEVQEVKRKLTNEILELEEEVEEEGEEELEEEEEESQPISQ